MYIGIDAGAYSLVMSYIANNGETVAVKDRSGNEEYRCAFSRGKNGEGEVVERFGNTAILARNNYLFDPSAICRSVKLEFGNSDSPESDSVMVGGKEYNLAELMEKLLTDFLKEKSKQLKIENIELKLGKNDVVCLGVPVKYNGKKRALMKKLLINAMKNGQCLEIGDELPEIKIASEPVLGTVGNNYIDAFEKLKNDGQAADNRSALGRMNKDTLVLTFDMGHSTFDTSLLVPNSDKNGEPYIQLASDGITGSAGEAVTLAVMKLIVDKAHLTKPQESTKEYVDIYKQAESGKIDFGEYCADNDSLNFQGVFRGRAYSTDIKKSEFNEAIRAIVEKNVELCARLYEDTVQNPANEGILRNFKTDKSKFADLEIQLIGGSSNLDLVRELIKEKFAWLDEKNIKLIRPKNAVAYGAAVLASDDSVLRTTSFGYAVKASFFPKFEDVLKFLKLSELKTAAEYIAKEESFLNDVNSTTQRERLIRLLLKKTEDNGVDCASLKENLLKKYENELKARAKLDEEGYFHGLVGVIPSNAKNREAQYISTFKPSSSSAKFAQFKIYELEHVARVNEGLPACVADGYTIDDCPDYDLDASKTKFEFKYEYSESSYKVNPDLIVDLKASVNADGVLFCQVKERYGNGERSFSQDDTLIHLR